jgi:hypothetical protein
VPTRHRSGRLLAAADEVDELIDRFDARRALVHAGSVSGAGGVVRGGGFSRKLSRKLTSAPETSSRASIGKLLQGPRPSGRNGPTNVMSPRLFAVTIAR